MFKLLIIITLVGIPPDPNRITWIPPERVYSTLEECRSEIIPSLVDEANFADTVTDLITPLESISLSVECINIEDPA